MFQILGNYGTRGIGFIWYFHNDRHREEGLTITFYPYSTQDRQAVEGIRDKLYEAAENWLYPIQHPLKEWEIDAELLKQKKQFSELLKIEWLRGKIRIVPEINRIQEKQNDKIKLQVNFIVIPQEINS